MGVFKKILKSVFGEAGEKASSSAPVTLDQQTGVPDIEKPFLEMDLRDLTAANYERDRQAEYMRYLG